MAKNEGTNNYSYMTRRIGGTTYKVKVVFNLSLIHISEPTRQEAISYAVFCL